MSLGRTCFKVNLFTNFPFFIYSTLKGVCNEGYGYTLRVRNDLLSRIGWFTFPMDWIAWIPCSEDSYANLSWNLNFHSICGGYRLLRLPVAQVKIVKNNLSKRVTIYNNNNISFLFPQRFGRQYYNNNNMLSGDRTSSEFDGNLHRIQKSLQFLGVRYELNAIFFLNIHWLHPIFSTFTHFSFASQT